jgi:hypothetical protein
LAFGPHSCFRRAEIGKPLASINRSTTSPSTAKTGFEKYTVPYFDTLITKEPTHPSYDFRLNRWDDLYMIVLNYPTLPSSATAYSLMSNMIWFVASNYPPKYILCAVFLNDETVSIIDGNAFLYYDPQTKIILTDKQKINYTKTTSNLGDYSMSVEKRKDAFGGVIIELTFIIKSDLAQNPDAVVNIMLTRLIQEIKSSSSKLGICSARAYDKDRQPIDGASLEFSPKDGVIDRIWYRVNGHDFRTEKLSNIDEYK